MMNKQHIYHYFLIALVGLGILMVLSIVSTSLADYGLPPRGTSPGDTPGAAPAPVVPVGGRLQLHAQFSADWPWEKMKWQDVWVSVQWADDKGNWFDVTGWQGTLDSISETESGWVGVKEWWAGEEDLGTGPFRWLVYQKQGGPLLTVSDPFYLPTIPGSVVTIEQPLHQ